MKNIESLKTAKDLLTKIAFVVDKTKPSFAFNRCLLGTKIDDGNTDSNLISYDWFRSFPLSIGSWWRSSGQHLHLLLQQSEVSVCGQRPSRPSNYLVVDGLVSMGPSQTLLPFLFF